MTLPHSTSLQLENNLLREAIDSSISGVTIADAKLPDTPLIFINKAFEKFTGYKTSEVVGRNCRFLQGELTDQPGLKVIRESMRKQVSCTVLLKNFKKSGELFWNELILSPIFDQGGELTHFIGIQNDVTERESMRIKLSRSEHELQMAIKKLKRLIEDKNRLLSIVAHDLRSPLSNIIGLMDDLVSDPPEKNDPADFIKIALSEARSAHNLVNDLLNERTIKKGKIAIEKRPVDLENFSASVARESGVKAARKDIRLSVSNHFEVETFTMDALKVKQVLQNLIGNAVKFSDRGSEIEVEMRASESRISFTVCDYGQGIKPEELGKIFRTFESTSTKSTEGEDGFGVGLSIVKEIVELHGGEISVDSTPGEGTCFTVLLW